MGGWRAANPPDSRRAHEREAIIETPATVGKTGPGRRNERMQGGGPVMMCPPQPLIHHAGNS